MVNWTDHGSPLAIESLNGRMTGHGLRSAWNVMANSIGMSACIRNLQGRWPLESQWVIRLWGLSGMLLENRFVTAVGIILILPCILTMMEGLSCIGEIRISIMRN